MSDGLLQIDLPQMSKVKKRLKGMESKTPYVMTRAINDTLNYLKKEMANEARKEYVVKVSAAKKTISTQKARQSDLSGVVYSTASKKVPLKGFKNSPAKRVWPSPPDFYKAQVKQDGSVKPLSGSSDRSKAFIATMKSGHIGMFQRTGRKTKNRKLQIAELFGPSIPSMFKGKKTSKAVQDRGQKYLHNRLDYHVSRVMEAG